MMKLRIIHWFVEIQRTCSACSVDMPSLQPKIVIDAEKIQPTTIAISASYGTTTARKVSIIATIVEFAELAKDLGKISSIAR